MILSYQTVVYITRIELEMNNTKERVVQVNDLDLDARARRLDKQSYQYQRVVAERHQVVSRCQYFDAN